MQGMASLFVGLRDDFPDFLDDARKIGDETPHWRRMARVGFALASLETLDDGDAGYILTQLGKWQALPQPSLAFAALVLGVIMGKIEENILSEFDLLVMQAELRQFLEENAEILDARYQETQH
jgi:hypothetical protein